MQRARLFRQESPGEYSHHKTLWLVDRTSPPSYEAAPWEVYFQNEGQSRDFKFFLERDQHLVGGLMDQDILYVDDFFFCRIYGGWLQMAPTESNLVLFQRLYTAAARAEHRIHEWNLVHR